MFRLNLCKFTLDGSSDWVRKLLIQHDFLINCLDVISGRLDRRNDGRDGGRPKLQCQRGDDLEADVVASNHRTVSPILRRLSKNAAGASFCSAVLPKYDNVELLAKLSARAREFPAGITTLDRNLVISSDSRHI